VWKVKLENCFYFQESRQKTVAAGAAILAQICTKSFVGCSFASDHGRAYSVIPIAGSEVGEPQDWEEEGEREGGLEKLGKGENWKGFRVRGAVQFSKRSDAYR